RFWPCAGADFPPTPSTLGEGVGDGDSTSGRPGAGAIPGPPARTAPRSGPPPAGLDGPSGGPCPGAGRGVLRRPWPTGPGAQEPESPAAASGPSPPPLVPRR